MSVSLKENISQLDDEEILEKLANRSFTESAQIIAEEVLRERGVQHVQNKVDSLVENVEERESQAARSDKRNQNLFYYFFTLIGGGILVPMYFGQITTHPILLFIGLIVVTLPILALILKK